MLGDSVRRWRMRRAASRTEKGALVAVALKFLHSRKHAIVNRVLNVLLAAKVFFRSGSRRAPAEIVSFRFVLRTAGTVSRTCGGDRWASGARCQPGARSGARFSKSRWR